MFSNGAQEAVVNASQALTPAGSDYGQIRNVAFALVFAVKKLHTFLTANAFSPLTNRKPLLPTFDSPVGISTRSVSHPWRLVNFVLWYDIDVIFCQTIDIGQVDGVSRLMNSYQMEDKDSTLSAVFAKQDVRD